MNHLESLTEKLHALLPELREHEINIEHVMKALSVLGVSEDGWGFGLSIDGGFMRIRSSAFQEEDLLPHNIESAFSRGLWEDCPKSLWTFGLPLHKQSPELHEFLDNLLPSPNEE